ncbi:hypothetical protein GN244_ATG20788 [Phytophthora infestans]|uniref:Uncharacterized protein n=1 Tax=Phytophthora infestans TaxID=4787 RepID=A0A833S1J7_PHYIN|nr:hypothetical protein GN244_ATG20788 [Phytophthora infestans]
MGVVTAVDSCPPPRGVRFRLHALVSVLNGGPFTKSDDPGTVLDRYGEGLPEVQKGSTPAFLNLTD